MELGRLDLVGFLDSINQIVVGMFPETKYANNSIFSNSYTEFALTVYQVFAGDHLPVFTHWDRVVV